MQVDIIPIGNSRGIRIPKALLKECGFEKSAELTVENKQLILKKTTAPKKSRKKNPREGWAEAAKKMVSAGDGAFVDDYFSNRFDEEEWEW